MSRPAVTDRATAPHQSTHRPTGARLAFGILIAVVVHALFAVTVCELFVFLRGQPARPGNASLATDAVLAFQFAAFHSLLLAPRVRRSLQRVIAPPFYGLAFCTTTCVSLLLMFRCWQPGSWSLWELTGSANLAMQFLFFASWCALIYSLNLSGLGYQTGWTPWWYWVRGRAAPQRRFAPRGAYRVLRHPVYLSFLGLVWFTPHMTIDRAVLTAAWTVYVFVGSYLKDQRLLHYLGGVYAHYQCEVPGYPGMLFGPLARRRLRTEMADDLPGARLRITA